MFFPANRCYVSLEEAKSSARMATAALAAKNKVVEVRKDTTLAYFRPFSLLFQFLEAGKKDMMRRAVECFTNQVTPFILSLVRRS